MPIAEFIHSGGPALRPPDSPPPPHRLPGKPSHRLGAWLALAFALTFGTAGAFGVAWQLFAIDPAQARLRGTHVPPERVDGLSAYWARDYTKIELSDPGWRPLAVALQLRAAPGAPGGTTSVSVAVDDIRLGTLEVTGEWQTYAIRVTEPSAVPDLVAIQLFSETFGEEAKGAGIGSVLVRPDFRSIWSLGVAGIGALFGFVAWVATPYGRAVRAQAAADLARAWRHPVASLGLGFGVCVLALGIPMAFAWTWDAAENAVRFATGLMGLMVFGRLGRRLIEGGRSGVFPPILKDPLADFLGGLVGAVLLLYGVSFLAKRVLSLDAAPALYPAGFGCVLGILLLHWWKSDAAGDRLLSALDWTRLSAFLLVFSSLALPHWVATLGYSGDPEQHIAWVNEIEQHGFVPDTYLGTSLLIDYPLGFHAFAYALGAPGGLLPSTAVNLFPVLASTLFVYLVVRGAAELLPRVEPRGRERDLLVVALFGALAVAFNSSQFGIWTFYEGTGRLIMGVIHVLPVVIFFGELARYGTTVSAPARPAREPDGTDAAPTDSRRVAAILTALAIGGLLTFIVNPTHLPLQALSSVAALGASVASTRRFPLRALLPASAAAAGLALAVVLAEPYTYRPLANALGWQLPDQSHIVERQADFFQRFDRRTCLRLDCLTAALNGPALAGAALRPLGTFGLGWIERLGSSLGLAGELPGVLRGWAFPDLTGWNLGPFHGAVGLLLVAVTLATPWIVRRAGSVYLVALAGLLGTLALHSSFTAFLERVIDLRDPALWLAPHYLQRAAVVFFNQAIWPVLVTGLVLLLHDRARRPSTRRTFWIVIPVVLGLVVATAARDVRANLERLPITKAAPQPSDIETFRRLERRIVPAGEAYLVSGFAAFVADQKMLLSNDPSTPFYLQSSRPSVFLFSQSYGTLYSASDLEETCRAIRRGDDRPAPIREHQARWAVAFGSPGITPDVAFRQRTFCGVPMPAVFPGAVEVARDGRLGLYRLW